MNEYSRDKWSDEKLLDYYLGEYSPHNEINDVRAELLSRMKPKQEARFRKLERGDILEVGDTIGWSTAVKESAGQPASIFIDAGHNVFRPVHVQEPPEEFDCTVKDEWAERENAQRDAQLEAIRESEARTQQLEIARKGLGIICMTDGIGFAGQTAGEALREIGILENKVSHKTSSETDVI